MDDSDEMAHAEGDLETAEGLVRDWFYAGECIWILGRAHTGHGTAQTTDWVVAQGQAATLAAEWRALPTCGERVALRGAQVTSFTNRTPRMSYDRYRAAGWDIGSGTVESAYKHLTGAREKGPGMRWSEVSAASGCRAGVGLQRTVGDF